MTRHLLFSGEKDVIDEGQLIIVIMLLIFQFFASAYSLFEIYRHRLSYFTNPWKIIDLLAHVFTWIYLIGYLAELDIHPIFLALSIWFMWCRLISFIRVIDKVRYYIRMIIDIIKGMVSFLMILLICIFAHSLGLMALSEGDEYGEHFMIAYR